MQIHIGHNLLEWMRKTMESLHQQTIPVEFEENFKHTVVVSFFIAKEKDHPYLTKI